MYEHKSFSDSIGNTLFDVLALYLCVYISTDSY